MCRRACAARAGADQPRRPRGCGSDGPVAVISYDFWRRYFQAEPGAIGRTLRLNQQPFTIVGVTPPWMKGLNRDLPYDVAIPIGCEPLLRGRRACWTSAVTGGCGSWGGSNRALARKKPKAAWSFAPEVFRATVPSYWSPGAPAELTGTTARLSPAATGFSGGGRALNRTALVALMAIAGLVAADRLREYRQSPAGAGGGAPAELSMRMAIGASRRRLIRQLITESMLLAGLGACCGFLLALWGGRILVGFISRSPMTKSPVEIDLAPDLHVLGFTAAIAVVAALVFGLIPALRATRAGLNDELKERGHGAAGGSSRFRLGGASRRRRSRCRSSCSWRLVSSSARCGTC